MTMIEPATSIDVSDRGLAYGDGLFETIAYIDNTLQYWNLHWLRLMRGASCLQLDLPDEADFLSLIDKKLERCSGDKSAERVIKIIVTRGSGGRGYLFPENQACTLIVTTHPWPQRSEQDYLRGIQATVCKTTLAQQPALAGIKHLNRLEQVLARNEFDASQYQEGLMLAYCSNCTLQDSFVIEGTSCNLFFVIDGKLCTPEIDNCGIKGTIREVVIGLASRSEMTLLEKSFPLKQLADASEVFICNSIYGIIPIASIRVDDEICWSYTERTITRQFASAVNQPLKRPF